MINDSNPSIENEVVDEIVTALNGDSSHLALENKALRKALEELMRVNKELVAFNYMSSHQLKEPLRKIQFFASDILQSEYRILSARGKDRFNRINNAAERMQALIADLLEFSRAGAKETTLELVSLDAIVNDSQVVVDEIIRKKNASIVITGELGQAKVNLFQFQQVITILLRNALKFSKTDIPPIINISGSTAKGSDFIHEDPADLEGKLSADNTYYKLSIRDNGIGFESRFKNKIFDSFVQLHSVMEYPGNGIGLAIVKKVIDNHRGIITAESTLGDGATFNIYIPG